LSELAARVPSLALNVNTGLAEDGSKYSKDGRISLLPSPDPTMSLLTMSNCVLSAANS